MITVPSTVPFEDDELLYSWLLRLPVLNGYCSFRTFFNAFIALNHSSTVKGRFVPEYSLLRYFESICQATANEDRMEEVFLATGLFPFYRLFWTAQQQGRVINSIFSNNANSPLWVPSVNGMISTIRYCPECMKEELKNQGFFYLHRSHQLPGIRVCHKHGCALAEFSGIRLHEMDEEPQKVSLTVENQSQELAYARYCHDLLSLNLDGSIEPLKTVLCRKLDRFSTIKNAYDSLKDGFDLPLSETAFKDVWKELHSSRYPNSIRRLVILIKCLFPDISELKNCLQDCMTVPGEFLKALQDRGCVLIGHYSPSIVTLQHECGQTVCVQPQEFTINWRCPACQESTFEFLAGQPPQEQGENEFCQEIRDLTGDEYELAGPYRDDQHKVLIRHKDCGKTFEMIPRTFLSGFRCPDCTPFLRDRQYDELIRSISGGQYEISAIRTNELSTIRNTLTGREIDLSNRRALAELRRPTPSSILPLAVKDEEKRSHSTKIESFQSWIEEKYPHGEPICLDDMNPDTAGLSYSQLKGKMQNLVQKDVLKSLAPGVYCYFDEFFTARDTAYYRYICSHGSWIGYPTGDNALYEIGILKEIPTDIRLVTNKETCSNTTGRTTKFMGQRLRIKGSAVPVNDQNHRVLMILDLITNLKKYMGGQNMESARQAVARYVAAHSISREDLALYQDKYAFSEPAIRDIFRRVDEMKVHAAENTPFRDWLEENFPKGEPVCMEDICLTMTDISDTSMKGKMRDLVENKILKKTAQGVYCYFDDAFSARETAYYRYICPHGQWIGYPTGDNALYEVGILSDCPTEIKLASNKEPKSKRRNRTVTFMGQKMIIKAPPVPVNNQNHEILMIIDLIANLKKFIKGGNIEQARQKVAEYVASRSMKREDFARYQDEYAYSKSAIDDLFCRIDGMR